MSVLRISTTTLEAFRLFVTEDWMSERDLIERITRAKKPEPTPDMLLGNAFDAVLNDPGRHYAPAEGGYRSGEFFFPDLMMVTVLPLIAAGVPQVKHTRRYGDAEVVAVADRIVGNQIIENKITTGTFDADKYQASFQWRFLADIFEPATITYRVFRMSNPETGAPMLKSIESLNVFPYENLHAECAELVRDFVTYVRQRNLEAGLAATYAYAHARADVIPFQAR